MHSLRANRLGRGAGLRLSAVQLGLDRVRQDHVNRCLRLALQAAGDDLGLTRHQRLEAHPRHVRRVVLGSGADGGVHHVRALEELGVGGARHERGDGDARVLDLFAHRLGEGLHERLRRVVDRVVGARQRRGDRRGEQHLARTALHHVGHHQLGEVYGRRDVELDQLQLGVQRGRLLAARELAACADPRVERDGVDRTASGPDLLVQPLDALALGQVDLHRDDLSTGQLQLLRCGRQVAVFSGDDQVVVVLRELLGKLEPDAAGGSGHHGERLGG